MTASFTDWASLLATVVLGVAAWVLAGQGIARDRAARRREYAQAVDVWACAAEADFAEPGVEHQTAALEREVQLARSLLRGGDHPEFPREAREIGPSHD